MPYPSDKDVLTAVRARDLDLCRVLFGQRFLYIISLNLRFAPDNREQSFAKWVRSEGGIPFLLPNSGTYKTASWKWDLIFAAMITRNLADHTDDMELREALKRLVKGNVIASIQNQIADGYDRGMVPHMNFTDQKNAEFWLMPWHSSITQPPIISEGINCLDSIVDRMALFPAVQAEAEWWLEERMFNGLPFVIHSWETGRDAARDIDSQIVQYIDFNRSDTYQPAAYTKLTPELLHSGRLDLIRALQEIAPLPPSSKGRKLFGLRSPDMAAYLVAMLNDLHQAGYSDKYREDAMKIKDSVNVAMWEQSSGFYYSLGRVPDPRIIAENNLDPAMFEVDQQGRIRAMVGSAFVPLYAEIPDKQQALQMLDKLSSPALFWAEWPIPMVDVHDPGYEPDEYWRGSTWININYFSIVGLRKYADRFYLEGDFLNADRFYQTACELGWKTAEETAYGYWEYYPSDENKQTGLGASDFTWSGLVLNILDELEHVCPAN